MLWDQVWLRMLLAIAVLLIATLGLGLWLSRVMRPDGGDGSGKKTGMKPLSAGRMLLLWQALLLLPLAILLGVRFTSGAASPLGVPLPPVPAAVTTDGVSFENASVARRRVPAEALEYLAPQPDGFPPLRYTFSSEYVDFSIQHPLGAETSAFGPDTVIQDGILAMVHFKLDYPLELITYSAPMHKESEKLTEYVARRRDELQRGGAQFFANTDPLLLPAYRFEHFEYEEQPKPAEDSASGQAEDGDPAAEGDAAADQSGDEPQGPVSHYMYFGPYGNRALTIDFLTTPAQHEAARPLVEKIMRSFKPTGLVLEMLRREWPDYAPPAA